MKQKFGNGDSVTILVGKNKGNTGMIVYIYSNYKNTKRKKYRVVDTYCNYGTFYSNQLKKCLTKDKK